MKAPGRNFVVLGLAAAAVGTACNHPARVEQEASVRGSDVDPPMPECTPRGEPMTRTGRIEAAKEDPVHRGKTFLGAWLVEDDGKRWVVAYARESPIRAFDGKRVEVHGKRCEPMYQALVADHLLIDRLFVLP